MFESNMWVYVIFVIMLGIISIIFIISIAKLPISGNNTSSYISKLIVYSLLVSFTAYLYAVVTSGGLLVQWQSLGSPSSIDKVVKILEVGYVQTESGDIYHWTSSYSSSEGNWEKVDKILENPDEKIVQECNSHTLSFLPFERRNFIDFKKVCIFWGFGVNKAAYAIDVDGHVYLWFHGGGEYSGIERFIYPIVGVIYGFVLGIVFILIIVSINFLRKKLKSKHDDLNQA